MFKVFNDVLYFLHIGCQWKQLPTEPHPDHRDKKEISYHVVYDHYRKWRQDGSLKRVWEQSIFKKPSSHPFEVERLRCVT